MPDPRPPPPDSRAFGSPLPMGSGPALSGAGDACPPDDPGRIAPLPAGDRYRRVSLLGEGGMGRVSVAHDAALAREVALKELAPHAMGSETARRRLEREAWITAQLDHPGVVAVHDAGRLPDGSPFYTMRLVRGRTLEQEMAGLSGFAGKQRLLRHFLAACEAVASAHSAGVLHRDLKPQNILVGRFGETQVVDWGLACRAGDPAGDDPDPSGATIGPGSGPGSGPAAVRTQDGAVVGSPAWMSPEQARGERADRRSDVWSLGAILYGILADAPPYPGDDAAAVLAAVRAGPPPPIRREDVPPDLAAIAARAMSPDPGDRYPDAGALAEDLARWFEGRQVLAHTYTPRELLLRLIAAWRVPLAVGLAGLIAVGLAVGIGVARTARERDRAVEAEVGAREALALALVERAVAALQVEDRARAESLAAEALLTTESPEARGVLAAFGVTGRPRLLRDDPSPPCLWRDLSSDGTRMLCGGEFQTSLWAIPADGPPREQWSRPHQAVSGLLPDDPDAPVLLRGTRTTRTLVSPRDGAVLQELPILEVGVRATLHRDRWLYYDGCYFSLYRAVAPQAQAAEPPLLRQNHCDEPTAAAAIADVVYRIRKDGLLLTLSRDGAPLASVQTSLRDDQEAWAILPFTPPGGGQLLAAGTIRGRIGLLDPVTGDWVRSADGGPGLRQLLARPDGALVAVSQDGVRLWSPDTGGWLANLPGGPEAAATAADGTLLLAGDRLQRWHIPAAATPSVLLADAGLSAAVPSPDGRLAALALADGWLRVVDLQDGRLVHQQRLAEGVIKGAAFTPDGRALAVSGTGMAQVVALDTRTWQLTPLPEAQTLRRIVALADGSVIGQNYGTVLHRWRPEAGAWRRAPLVMAAIMSDLAASPGGERAVLVDERGWLLEITPEDPPDRPPRVLWTQPGVLGADISADGRRVCAFTAAQLLLLDRAPGPGGISQISVRAVVDVPGTLRDVALSPDGRRVAVAAIDGRARVYDADQGRLLAVLPGHTERVAALEFASPDRLLTASWDHSARLWDLSVLATPAQELIQTTRRDWGISLQQAISTAR